MPEFFDAKRSSSPMYATPHLDKLRELMDNEKMPAEDLTQLERVVLPAYQSWVGTMDALPQDGDERVRALVRALNEYKRKLELMFVWDSKSDFLYRQRGQLKLDSSVIEEFLPRLVDPRVIQALRGVHYSTGPRTAFAAAYFATSLTHPSAGAGLGVRTKDQDFTIGTKAYLQASLDPDFPPQGTESREIFLAFVAAECKTNLDKTMFQEATATAHDLKVAITGSRYYLLCEWLDMTPISTAATDIDRAIILRGKRLNSNVRKSFSSYAERQANREWYISFLDAHPIKEERILFFVGELRRAFEKREEDEEEVLARGHF